MSPRCNAARAHFATRRSHRIATFALAVLWFTHAACAQEPVLGEGTLWRMQSLWQPPVIGTSDDHRPASRAPEAAFFTAPPAEWTQVEFDDGSWARATVPMFGGHGFRQSKHLAVLFARAAFIVDNPQRVSPLTLQVRYRGGAAVYLNGREVARQHLADGELTAETTAQDYPRDAYLTPGGTRIGPPGEHADDDETRRRLDLRVRELRVTLPAEHLRSGRNVVAIRIHRAALPQGLPSYAGGRASWNSAGLLTATLDAATAAGLTPNLAPPAPLQVWNADPLQEITPAFGHADPGSMLRPIRLIAARGGSASGQVVVSRRDGLGGASLQATLSALTHENGRDRLPGESARIRFAHLPIAPGGGSVGYFDILAAEPMADTAVQPIWVTVDVPADAVAGRYTAALTLRHAHGSPVTVPVELHLSELRLPRPAEYSTFMDMMQSPDTTAMRYEVPLYSDDHFKLMEPSLQLLGRIGSDVMYVTAVRRTHFGNDHAMIRFRALPGGGVEPDFSAFDRYAALFAKHVGRPKVVALQVWTADMDGRGQRTPTIRLTRVERDGRLTDWDQPVYGEPGSETLWKPVIDGLKQRLEKLDWPVESLTLGIGVDHRPHPDTVAFFQRIAPEVRWMLFTHGRGDPRPRDGRLTINNMEVGFQVYPDIPSGNYRWGSGQLGGYDNPFLHVTSMRGYFSAYSPLGAYRTLVDRGTRSGYRGVGRIGLDFWPTTGTADTRGSGLLTRFRTNNVLDINLMRDNPRSLTAPGLRGALSTVRLEMLHEGRQLTEARILIERALADDAIRARLGENVVQRCIEIVDEHNAAILIGRHDWSWFTASNWQARAIALLDTAAAVQATLK